jgi:hypothetical protein
VADWNPSQNQLPNWLFSVVFQRCEVAKWIELDKNQVQCQAVVLAGLNASVLLLVCHITRKSMFEL